MLFYLLFSYGMYETEAYYRPALGRVRKIVTSFLISNFFTSEKINDNLDLENYTENVFNFKR